MGAVPTTPMVRNSSVPTSGAKQPSRPPVIQLRRHSEFRYDRGQPPVTTSRMRRLLPILTIAALTASAPLHAQDLVLSRFTNYVDALRVQAGIPGLAASIIGPDDVIWEQAFGRQDLGRSIATRTDTPFHLDGLTQIFTPMVPGASKKDAYR